MVGASPLPTLAQAAAANPMHPEADVGAALRRCVNLGLADRVYLNVPDDVVAVDLAAGQVAYVPVAREGKGDYGYQITSFGQNCIAGFWEERAKALWNTFLNSLARDYGGKLVMAVLGFALAVVLSLCGVDVAAWVRG